MKITVRNAVDNDASDICALLRHSITENCFIDHEDEQDILDEWLRNKTVENIQKLIELSDSHTIVAVNDSQLAGVATVNKKGEITLCYVLPGFLHQGIGKKLLQEMCDIAKEWGNKEVCLISTLTAKSFYEHNGFISNGEPTGCFGLTGYPMKKILTDV